MKPIYLTEEQLKEKKAELELLIGTRRKEIVERIKEAKSFGDLSENSEYDSAREEQAFIEAKIKELETMISNSKIMSKDINTDVVGLGTIVTYENMSEKKDHTYKIVGVGSDPSNPQEPTISVSTPIARKLSGKKVGDVVEVEIPKGKVKLKIKKIQ